MSNDRSAAFQKSFFAAPSQAVTGTLGMHMVHVSMVAEFGVSPLRCDDLRLFVIVSFLSRYRVYVVLIAVI